MKLHLTPTGYKKLFYTFAVLASVHSLMLMASTVVIDPDQEFVREHLVVILAALIYVLMASAAFTAAMILLFILPLLARIARFALIETADYSVGVALEPPLDAVREGPYAIRIKPA